MKFPITKPRNSTNEYLLTDISPFIDHTADIVMFADLTIEVGS